MPATVSSDLLPREAAVDPLDAWLKGIGLHRGMELGVWRLSGVEIVSGEIDRGVRVAFSDRRAPERVIMIRLLLIHASRPAFARTASLDISHDSVPVPLKTSAAKLTLVVHAIVRAHDEGGLLPPPPAASKAASGEAESGPAAAALGGAYAGASGREPDDDPDLRVQGGEHFLDWRMVGVDDLDQLSNAVYDITRDRLGGMIIRGVFSADEMAGVVARLEGGELEFPRTFFPPQFKSHFLGRALDGSDPELGEYLDDAARLIADTRAAFAGGADFQTRLEEVFRRIAGGRAVEVPRYRDGRAYSPATIRVLPEGGQIGTHCGNEMGSRPAYTHLNTLIDNTDQVSYFVTLQASEGGGELIVYSLRYDQLDEGQHMRNERTNVDALLPLSRWEAYRPEAGDLLIFDGGRYLHRVSVVQGPRTRWTIGGFLMLSQDDRTVYYYG